LADLKIGEIDPVGFLKTFGATLRNILSNGDKGFLKALDKLKRFRCYTAKNLLY
jgi:hypothetical protein